MALAKAGHDVLRANDILPDSDDRPILAFAAAERRVLITCDRDFGELVFKHRAATPPAIIYVRFEPDTVEEIVPRIIEILDFDRLEDHMTVIGGEGNRRTIFPGKTANDA